MAGNSSGGKLAAQKNRELYGEDFYKRIGQAGGQKTGIKKGFALSGKAREAGSVGGSKSRRVGTIRVEWNGRTVTLPEIARATGKEYRDVYQLYKHGRLHELQEV